MAKRLTPVGKFRDHLEKAWSQAKIIHDNAITQHYDSEFTDYWLDIMYEISDMIKSLDE